MELDGPFDEMKFAHRKAVLFDGNSIACSPGFPQVLTMSSANATMSLWMKKLSHDTMISIRTEPNEMAIAYRG